MRKALLRFAAAACIRWSERLVDASDRLMPRSHASEPRPAVLTLHADPAAVSDDKALAEYGFAMAKAWRIAGHNAEADAWQAWGNRPWMRSLGRDPDAKRRPRLWMVRGSAA